MPQRTNAFWFFVAFMGGGAVVLWTKSAFDNAWFAAIVAAAVVLALAIHYMLNDEDAPEEEGDNVYYLGLLFTLGSLIFTLVELFGVDTGAERNAEKIRALLESFGIALTSTVAGIAGRVLVQNWQRVGPAGRPAFPGVAWLAGRAGVRNRERTGPAGRQGLAGRIAVKNRERTGSAEGPGSAEDTAIPALPPAGASSRELEQFNRYLLGRIARDLTQGANALARFHRIVRSHASDTRDYLRSHRETLKRESAAFRDTLQRNAETFAQELKSKAENTLDAVGGSLGAAAKQAEALPERLRSAHDGYLAEVRETTRSFHDEIRSASDQSLDTLRRSFDTAAQQSLSLAQSTSTVHERTGKAFDSLGSVLGHASDASAAFGSSAHQAAKSTAVLEVEVDKLRAALATIHAGTEAMKGMLHAMEELDARIRTDRDAEQTAMAVRGIGEALRTITAQAAAATERTAEATELFDALTRSVRTTEAETRRAAEALRVLAAEAEARAETLRQRQGPGWRFWNRSR